MRRAALPSTRRGAILLALALGACAGESAEEGATRPLTQEGPNGVLTAEGTERYEDGSWVKHGPFVFRDDRGEVVSTGSYEGGLEVGPWEQRYEDGSRGEGSFRAGRRSGPWRTFHPNGAAQDAGSYEDGLRVGEWTSHRADGTLLRRATYAEGQLEGPVTYFGPDGRTVDRERSGLYRAGERVGPSADR